MIHNMFQVNAIGMSQYVDAFRKNEIDGAELKLLGHDTLQNSLNICKQKNLLVLLRKWHVAIKWLSRMI